MENEFNFLNKIFSKECKTINNIRKEAFYEFIKMKTNERFVKFNLGISNSFDYDQDLSREVFFWFFHLVSGNISNDFFTYNKKGSPCVNKFSFYY